MNSFTFSGHETFSLRISWLPKAVAALEQGARPFNDPREGMIIFGLGKNMVRSLHFWVIATGLVSTLDGRMELTDLAKQTLSREKGLDPFLEDIQTMWLLHWHLCQGWDEGREAVKMPFAWHYFSNLLTSDEISPSEAMEDFKNRPDAIGKQLSPVTLRQHLDIFIKTYVHSSSLSARATPEDALDSPLTSLNLIKKAGERRLPNGKREQVFRVNDSAHKSLSVETFRYCLHQWWNLHRESEHTATLREISLSAYSPGKCLKIPESAAYSMMQTLASQYPKEFQLRDSQSQRVITRKLVPKSNDLLKSIYAR